MARTNELSIAYTGAMQPDVLFHFTVAQLAEGEAIRVYLNHQLYALNPAVTAAADGTASFSVTLPAGYSSDSLNLTVMGETNSLWQTATVPVHQTTPVLTVTPSSPTAGSVLDFSVSGFAPGETAALWFNAKPVASAAADGSGAAVLSYTPDIAAIAGDYPVVVAGSRSNHYLKKTITLNSYVFTVNAPATADPGSRVTLAASGLVEGETLHLLFDQTCISGSGIIAAAGSAALDYTIPPYLAAGNHRIRFVLAKSAVLIEKSIYITDLTPQLAASQSGTETKASLNLSGFLPGEGVLVYFDQRDVTANTTTAEGSSSFVISETGTLTLIYNFPASITSGDHSFAVIGKASQRAAYSTLAVEVTGQRLTAANSEGRAEGKPGDLLTLHADGFTASVDVSVLFGEIKLTPANHTTDAIGAYSATIVLPLGTAEGLHAIQIVAASVSELAQTTLRVDTTAPAVPELRATPAKRQITLAWDKSADVDTTSYLIYRKLSTENADSYVLTDTLDAAVNTVTHSLTEGSHPLAVDVNYHYIIKARDRLGNLSVASTVLTAALLPDTAAPVLEYMGNPYAGYRNGFYVLQGSAHFTPTISDDRQASTVLLEYSKNGTNYTALPAVSLTYQGQSYYSGLFTFRGDITLDTLAITNQPNFGDGLYTIRLSATDAAGKTAVRTQQYYIDNTKPAAPTNLAAAAGPKMVKLTWNYGEISDVNYFLLQFGPDLEHLTTYYLSASARSYDLVNLLPATEYIMQLAARDDVNNISDAVTVRATPIIDTEKPILPLDTISPAANSRISKNLNLQLKATDNVGLSRFLLSIAPFGSTEFTSIDPAEINSYIYSNIQYLYLENLSYQGNYTLRLIAVDSADLQSDPVEITYQFDTQAPQLTALTATAISGGIMISWAKAADADLYFYYLLRKAPGETDYSYYRYISPSYYAQTSGLIAYLDYAVTAGETYAYKISAYDDLNNSTNPAEATAVSAQPGAFNLTLSLTPTQDVKPGAVLSLTATGLSPYESAVFSIDGLEIFTAYANEKGNLLYDWSYIKNTTSGEHTLQMQSSSSNQLKSVNFTAVATKLAAPGNVNAAAGIMNISLSWDAVSTAYGYQLYRKADEGDYLLLVDKIYGRTYTDYAVAKDIVYSYQVAAFDRYNAIGEKSIEAIAKPDPDQIAPEIAVFVSNRDGNLLTLVATVSDDIRLAKVDFAYKPAGTDDSAYQMIESVSISGSKKTAAASCSFDTSALTQGNYTLRAIVWDGANNQSTPRTLSTTISTSLPHAPQNLTAVAGQMRIALRWEAPGVIEEPIARYNIYRKVGEADFVLLSTTTLTNYTDLAVGLATAYTYQVKAVNVFGYEGPEVRMTTPVTALADTSVPVISGFAPAANSRLGGQINMSVIASDNVAVKQIDFFVVTANGLLTLGRSETGSISFNSVSYQTEGDLVIKARVRDAAGNQAEQTVTYKVDNVAPTAPLATAASGELSIQLTWSLPLMPTDLSYYNVYVLANNTTPEQNTTPPVAKVTTLFYNYKVGTTASFYITAVDSLGNESIASNIVTATPGTDRTAPVILSLTPNNQAIVRADTNVRADATDNVAVNSYLFEVIPMLQDTDTGSLKIMPAAAWTELSLQPTTPTIKTGSFVWNTQDSIITAEGLQARYPDGYYTLRVTAKDMIGNASLKTEVVKVANHPPIAPDGLRVDAGEWRLMVSWKPMSGSDVAGYKVERQIEGESGFTEVAETTSNVYIETGVSPLSLYSYRVAMINDLGNLGPWAAISNQRALEETSTPSILSMSPLQDQRFNSALNLKILAQDEVAIEQIKLSYYRIGDQSSGEIPAEAVYTEIAVLSGASIVYGNVETSENDVFGTDCYTAAYRWTTEALAEGLYALKAVAYNKGNQTAFIVKKYYKDTQPPAAPGGVTLTDPGIGQTLNLTWTSGADVLRYEIYRSTNAEAVFTYAEPAGYLKLPATLSPTFSDTGLTDGMTYYYHIVTVDAAGNVSNPSSRVSGTPTAKSDLGIQAIYTDPAVLILGRNNSLKASMRNDGTARATGVVTFYYFDGTSDIAVGSVNVDYAANTGGETSLVWLAPLTLSASVTVKATVTTNPGSDDISAENNQFTRSSIATNQPPTAVITLPAEPYESGFLLSFNANASSDVGGRIVSYAWDFGNSKKAEGAAVTSQYTLPGEYTIRLTVKDNNGAETTAVQTIIVGDKRPDLYVDSIRWTPSETKEGDVVTITAVIGNKGFGNAALGFLTGFYIDNQYMGYSKCDVNLNNISLARGETREVSFNYVAAAGVHVVKVVANDILDTLKETDKGNNNRSAVLSNQQISFADVGVESIVWVPDGTVFDTQQAFAYRTVIKNHGSASAANFGVSLYIDDEYRGRQMVPNLAVGAEMTLNYYVAPAVGIHKVEIKVDDLNPVLIEENTTNNNANLITEDFTVIYPEITVGNITWKPTETTLTEGTSITFEAKLINNSTINITKNFLVHVAMDGRVFKTITVYGLKAGEVKDVLTKWSASSGEHSFKVIVDAKKAVIDPDTTVEKSITIPKLSILYPNLHISNVSYSPLSVETNKMVSFLVSINNQSVATAFKRFNIGLYVDGKAVAGSTIDGIRGYSTVPVVINWTPETAGLHTIQILADSFGELTMSAATEGIRRSWTTSLQVSEALVLKTNPNKEAQDEDFMAVLYTSGDGFIPLSASLRHASISSQNLGPDEDASVSYTLKKGSVLVSGFEGQMAFNSSNRQFEYQLPITTELTTGTYTLEFLGSCGTEILSSICNIMIVKETTVTLETNKDTYLLGETIRVSGRMTVGGQPVANERVVLDFQLQPRLTDPLRGYDAKGNEIMMIWQAEEIVFAVTDLNGNYEYKFTPFTGEAGDWTILAFAYQNALGGGAPPKEVKVWGMAASPASQTLVATKNSQFSKEIKFRHAAPNYAEGDPLTSVSAILVATALNNGVSATIDTSAMARSLAPGAETGVILNVSAGLNCDDTATYEIVFSSAQGATCKTRVTINLRPATPIPVTDVKSISIGVNPADNVSRIVTVTNKGKGYLDGLKITLPGSIPWVTAGSIGSTRLAPNESTTFTVEFSPGVGVALGQYQDKLVVSDATGKFYANVALSAEISSAKTGGISFRVTDDVGTKVGNADITIISKEPYTSMAGGVETQYYPNFTTRTDANGVAQFYEKPLGDYDLVVMAAGRKKFVSQCSVMPSAGAPFMDILLQNEPISIEWTVVPTTIVDEYEIKLELTFGAHIPVPAFGFNPPWVNIPKEVNEPIVVEANVVNTGLIAITDVVASVVRANKSETGISIIGGGYLGEIGAHSSAKIRLQVQPGVYQLLFSKNAAGNPLNYIKFEGTYVSFDSDTGLPIDPAPVITGVLPLYNPSETSVTLQVRLPEENAKVVEEEVKLPEGQMEELRYIAPAGGNRDDLLKPGADSAYEIVQLTLSQKATLERQAFDATLKITNGYPEYALQNLRVDVTVTDADGKDVTNKNFVIATGINGLTDLDGNDSLAAGKNMTATWQIIPGSDLGGTSVTGKLYYAKALISYYVNGRLVQTQTEGVEITIVPQPKLTLNYYVPHTVLSNTPFKLAVKVSNSGYGEAKNLIIDSGKLEISSNQSGLLTDFEILGSSFGSTTGSNFKLEFGNIGPAVYSETTDLITNQVTGSWTPTEVSGYWLVRWNLPVEAEENPYEGEFRDFKATLTHKDYKGVQLNPLIVGVTTSIIGKEDVLADLNADGALAVVNEGNTGFPDFLMNLVSGLRIPIFVPDSVETSVSYETGGNYLQLKSAKPTAALDYNSVRYQIIMLPAPEGCGNISAVKRSLSADSSNPSSLSFSNYWKDFGNIYIVDQIPVSYDASGSRVFLDSWYIVEFGSGVILGDLGYSRFVYTLAAPGEEGGIPIGVEGTGSYIKDAVYYDTGIYPDQGENDLTLRVLLDNRSKNVENGSIRFSVIDTTIPLGENQTIFNAEVAFVNLQPYITQYVSCSSWVPAKGGVYQIKAELLSGGEAIGRFVTSEAIVNSLPYGNAGADIANAVVLQPIRFDASRSYDRDGYITSFVWDFGDGESGYGLTPTHTYLKSGSYKVKLYVMDNNLSTTWPPKLVGSALGGEPDPATVTEQNEFSVMQITVLENRPDLFVQTIEFSESTPAENSVFTVTATLQNGTSEGTAGGLTATPAPFLVGFYLDDVYRGYVRVEDAITVNNTKEVSFDLTMPAGGSAHKVSVIANDIGKYIEEADFDNNRLDQVINGTQTDFADLAVENLQVSAISGDTVQWHAGITVQAKVKNLGSAAAGAFKIVAYANDTLIYSALVDALAVSGEENISFPWLPETSGDYQLRLLADGPLSTVVEMVEDNNSQTQTIKNLNVTYADLTVQNVRTSLSGSIVPQGTNVVLFANILNQGSAANRTASKAYFYVNNRFIGAAEFGKTEALAAGASTTISYIWENPDIAAEEILVIVDPENKVLESNEANNTGSYYFSSPLTVTAAQLQLMDLVTNTTAVQYGDSVTTLVKVKNSGDRAITTPFATALYVNNRKVGMVTTDAIGIGSQVELPFTWKADQLPTGSYLLRAYTDSEAKLNLTDRSQTYKSAVLSVGHSLVLTPVASAAAYSLGEASHVSLGVASSAASWSPLGDAAVSVQLYSVSEGAEPVLTAVGEPINLVYDPAAGTYQGVVTSPAAAGSYRLRFNAVKDLLTATAETDIVYTNAFQISLSNATEQSYTIGQSITAAGTVTDANGAAIPDAAVTISVIGEETWQFSGRTDANGAYSIAVNLPTDCGGAYTMKASASIAGVKKQTASIVFFIDGLYLALNSKVTIVQGYDQMLAGFVTNLGVTAADNISLVVSGLPAGLAIEPLLTLNATNIAAESSQEIQLKLSAAETLAAGVYEITLTAGNASHVLTVSVVAAEAKYSINIIGEVESGGDGLRKEALTMSLRQGEMKASVIQVTNSGTANLTGLTVDCDLPFVRFSATPVDGYLIKPVNKGYTIRDAEGRASIVVAVSPSNFTQTGLYEGSITLTSNAGVRKIPIVISVGSEQVASLTYEVRNDSNTPLQDATVELSGVVQQKDPVSFSGKTDINGRITFSNIPAGAYQLTATADLHSTLSAAVDLPALNDRLPQIITLTKQPMVFGFEAAAEDSIRSSSTKSVGYDSVVYKAEQLAASTEPQLQPNLPADEQQFWYISGKILNRLSIRNPAAPITLTDLSASDSKLKDVTLEVVSTSKNLPLNAFLLKGESGYTPVRYIGDLAAGQVIDLIWSLDIDRLFVMAKVAAVGSTGEFQLTFDGTKVSQAMVDAYVKANDPLGEGSLQLVAGSYTAGGNSFNVKVTAGSDQTYRTPTDRIPLYFGNQVYLFDATIKASGTRSDNGATVETLIPVRVRYLAPDYEIWGSSKQNANQEDSGSQTTATDAYDENPGLKQEIQLEAAFPSVNGQTAKGNYSQNFLKEMGYGLPEVPEEATKNADLDFGFSSGAGFAEQVVGLKLNLTNTSSTSPMTDLSIRLLLTDNSYDAEGNLIKGGSPVYPAVNLIASATGENAPVVDGYGITLSELNLGETLKLNYQLKLDEVQDIYSAIAEFDPSIAKLLQNKSSGKIYARFLYEYTQDGKQQSVMSSVREFEVKAKPKVYISYDLEAYQSDPNRFTLTAYVTNLGEGAAEGVYVSAPIMPETEYKFVVTSGNSTKGTNLGDGKVQLGTIQPGETEKVYFNLIRIEVTAAQKGTKLSLGKLAELPAMPVKSEIAGNLIVAPMKMEAMNTLRAHENFLSMQTELDNLQVNLEKVVDKTVSELARSILDQYDYARILTGAVGITKVYEMTSGVANLIGWIKSIAELPAKLKGAFTSADDELKEVLNGKVLTPDEYKLFAATQQAYQGYGTKLLNLYTSGISWFNNWIGNTLDDYINTAKDVWNTYSDAKKGKAGVEAMADYEVKANQALDTLGKAAKFISDAVNTKSKSERTSLTTQGKAALEAAQSLIQAASEIKTKNMAVFESIASGSTNGWIGGEVDRYYLSAANAYVNEVEFAVQETLKIIAAQMQAIVAVNAFEDAAEGMKASAENLTKVTKEAQQVLDATNNMLNNVGYQPNQSVMDQVKNFRSSSTVLDFAKSWLTSKLTIVDMAALQNISKTTPTLVKNLGNLAIAVKTAPEEGFSNAEVADLIFECIFPNSTEVAKEKYAYFYDEFDAYAPAGGSKTAEYSIYTLTQAIKLSSTNVIDLDAYEKAINQLATSKTTNSQAVMNAAVSSATRKSNVFNMLEQTRADLALIGEMIQGYLDNDLTATAYYPSGQVLDYLKSLNTQLKSMYANPNGSPIPITRVGRYRNLWVYTADGMDLVPDQITLFEVYQLQQEVDASIAEGFDAIYQRHIVNMMKDIETRLTLASTAFAFMGSVSGASGSLSAIAATAAQMINTSSYVTALDSLDATILTKLSKQIGELAVNTTLMVNKETSIASNLLDVFNTLENWRKVDPELPLTVLSQQATDVALQEGYTEGQTTVAISIRNEHTGSVTIAPTVEIYDSYGLVNSVTLASQTLLPGQTGQFSGLVAVPHNALRDAGGYIAVFSFEASEAETMTISPTYGPYTAAFNAHRAAALAQMKSETAAAVKTSQPLGGYLAGKIEAVMNGQVVEVAEVVDSQTVTISKSAGTILRIFCAAISGSGVSLSVSDSQGKPVSAFADLINPADFVLISDPAAGTYTVTVSNGAASEQGFALQVVEHPNYGTVAGIYTQYTNVQAAQNSSGEWQATIPINLYETGLLHDLTGITFTVSELSLQSDAAIKIVGSEMTIQNAKNEVQSQSFTIPAGTGKQLALVIKPNPDHADGIYTGSLSIHLTAEAFNTGYSTHSGWTANGDGSDTLIIPLALKLDTAVPNAPSFTAEVNAAAANTVTISGTAIPGERIYIYTTEPGSELVDAADQVYAVLTADANGSYTMDLVLEMTEEFLSATGGSLTLYAKAAAVNGMLSEASAAVSVNIDYYDTTAPQIILLSPYAGVELSNPVSQIRFEVFDGESAVVEESIQVDVNGSGMNAAWNRTEKLYEVNLATPLTGGTNNLRISATNEIGLLATETYDVILGDVITAVFTVMEASTPIAGATVSINGGDLTTDLNGTVSTELAAGNYTYTVSKTGYLSVNDSKNIQADDRSITVFLQKSANITYTISSAANAVANAKVEIKTKAAVLVTSGYTNAAGQLTLQLPLATYDCTISKVGYLSQTAEIAVTQDAAKAVSLANDTTANFLVTIKLQNQLNTGLEKTEDSNHLKVMLGAAEWIVTGNQTAQLLSNGDYSLIISADGYQAVTLPVTVAGAAVTETVVLMSAGAAINYTAETLNLAAGYQANTAADFSGVAVASGANFAPGSLLYIKQEATGAIVPLKSQERPSAPTSLAVSQTADNTATVTPIAGAEYRIDEDSWQDTNVFSAVSNFTSHSFAARIKATGTSYASLATAADALILYPQTIYTRALELDPTALTTQVTLGNHSGADANLMLVIAIYNANGRMLEMKTESGINLVNATEVEKVITFKALPQGGRCKVFLIDTLSSLQPLADSSEGSISLVG